MLTKAEIDRLLKKTGVGMPDEAVMKVSEGWDLEEWGVSSRMIGCVYSYLKHRYQDGETLADIERNIGIGSDGISHSMRALEENGYLAISRARKPYQYRVIK